MIPISHLLYTINLSPRSKIPPRLHQNLFVNNLHSFTNKSPITSQTTTPSQKQEQEKDNYHNIHHTIPQS